MHEFNKENYILPDRFKVEVDNEQEEDDQDKKPGKKKKFAGGMVMEPITDIYKDFILLLDFNSLYPSIIMEYNICFTTVERKKSSIE